MPLFSLTTGKTYRSQNIRKRQLLLLVAVVFLSGCKDVFEMHPYDGRVTGECGMNDKNIEKIEQACSNKTTLRFIMMGDSQDAYDELEDFVNAVNQRDDIDFVIHGGDISDYGLTKEFEWGRDMMNKLKVPYVVNIGNHDCVATGKHVFQKIFGTENFSFVAGNVKFICLNTNAIEYDYSNPIPDFAFIESQRNDPESGYEKTVFVMHAPPYNEQFNNNVTRLFLKTLEDFPKVQFCLNAHRHRISVDDYGNGLLFYGCASMKDRNYLLFTITPDDQYTYEAVGY